MPIKPTAMSRAKERVKKSKLKLKEAEKALKVAEKKEEVAKKLAANKKMVEFLLPTVTRMLHKR